MTTDLSTLKDLLSEPHRIAIVSHKSPDGDAIGSSLGLFHYLNSKGHEVEVVMPNDYPQFLKWMPGNGGVILHEGNEQNAEVAVNGAEILFCLDFNAPARSYGLEDVIRRSKASKVMIDHHPDPEDFVDYVLSDTSACSTAELIHRFIGILGDSVPNAESATCLYCGIMTDTGGFRFPSTSAETHRIVAELMNIGADNAAIYDQVHNNSSEHRLRLLGYCINDKLRTFPEHGAAYISLSLDEKSRFQFQSGDTEGTVNHPLSISGIHFSAIFIEAEDMIKCSFRSIGNVNVNEFARAHFNGGGHRNAAGGRSDLTLEETARKFEELLPAFMESTRA